MRTDQKTTEAFIAFIFKCRDALIASVLDGVRASGNKDVHVKMKFTNRGYRLGKLLALCWNLN